MGGQGDVFGGRWKDAATLRLWPSQATTAEFAQQVATTGRQTGKQGITTGLCRLRKPLAILTWGCQCGRGCHSQGGKVNLPLVLSISRPQPSPEAGLGSSWKLPTAGSSSLWLGPRVQPTVETSESMPVSNVSAVCPRGVPKAMRFQPCFQSLARAS